MVGVQPPTNEEYKTIFTTFSDNSTCQASMQWTVWNSASDAVNGNDFEILADHISLFGYVTYHKSQNYTGYLCYTGSISQDFDPALRF